MDLHNGICAATIAIKRCSGQSTDPRKRLRGKWDEGGPAKQPPPS